MHGLAFQAAESARATNQQHRYQSKSIGFRLLMGAGASSSSRPAASRKTSLSSDAVSSLARWEEMKAKGPQLDASMLEWSGDFCRIGPLEVRRG